jgi:CheY-like chemotaxis protein
MHFPIDAVFMDGTLRVLKMVERIPPWRTASKRHAWGVLELAAGEIERRQIRIGDQLGVVQITDRLGAVAPASGLEGGAWTSVAMEEGAEHGSAGSTNGHEPDATRVLVVGTDRRFRSVVAALLTQRGCAVTLRERMTKVADLAAREGAEVVILDAGTSLTATAWESAEIEKLDPPVGVVVVGDTSDDGLAAMPVFAKWGSFETLFTAVEQAVAHNRAPGSSISAPPT